MREWFTASELAGLPALPADRRNVRIIAAKQSWRSRDRDVGKGFEYHITALPENTQAALLLRERQRDPNFPRATTGKRQLSAAASTVAAETSLSRLHLRDSTVLWARYERTSTARMDEAKRKLHLLDIVMQLIEHGTAQRAAFQAVGSNAGEAWRTMETWYHGTTRKPGVKHYHRSDWLAVLIDDYAGRSVIAECSDEAWEMFKADYLRLEKPGAMACYRRLERAAETQQWAIPAAYTFVRRVRREVPRTMRTLLRDGEEKLMKLYPALERSVRELHAMEWINGDGYEHNVFVIFPDGTEGRPKTWFWQDVYSRKILAYRVDQTENSDMIRCALADVLALGVPDHVTIDNTRAAANKWLTGGVPNRYRFKVKADDPLGIFPMLGVKVHWTSVHNGRGHGQAKPIERSFGVGGIGEVVDKHPAFAGAYTGPNPMMKPENYGSRKIPLLEFVNTLEQEIIAWNARPGRRTEICDGKLSFDQAFNQSYENSPIQKATEEQRRVCLLTAEAITVQRGGKFTLEAGKAIGVGRNRYEAPELIEIQGEKVVVRFDPQHLHEGAYVYTLGGKFLCEAKCTDASGFGDTEAGRAIARANKQRLRAAKEIAKAKLRMDVITAAGFIPTVETPTPPEAKIVRPFAAFERKAPVTRLTDEQRAEHEAAVIEFYREPEQIRDVRAVDEQPMPMYAYWGWLDAQLRAGAERNEHDRAFHEFFPRSIDYKVGKEFFDEFPDLSPAGYLPAWVNQEKSRLKAG